MKKFLFIIFIHSSLCTTAQRTFEIKGMELSIKNSNAETRYWPIKQRIIITDSVFSVWYNNKPKNFAIVKMVDSNYFKLSDGLLDYIVIIRNIPTKKYKSDGMIIVQEGNDIISYLY